MEGKTWEFREVGRHTSDLKSPLTTTGGPTVSSVSKRKKGTFFLTASLPDVVWNLIGVFSIFSGVKNNGLVNKVAEGNYLKGAFPCPVKLPMCYLKKRVSYKTKNPPKFNCFYLPALSQQIIVRCMLVGRSGYDFFL